MSLFTKWILLAAVAMVPLALLFPGRVPAPEITRHRMAFDRFRILEYAREHGQLPPALDALPRLALKPEADHYLEDGWNRKLIYQPDASGMVTLKSFGKDGVLGGADDAADIVFKFPSRNLDGTWVTADRYDYDSHKPAAP